jgi:hypothetical protein
MSRVFRRARQHEDGGRLDRRSSSLAGYVSLQTSGLAHPERARSRLPPRSRSSSILSQERGSSVALAFIKQALEATATALDNVERDVSPYWIGHRFDKQGVIVFRRRSPARERDLLFRPFGQAARFDRFRSRHVRP